MPGIVCIITKMPREWAESHLNTMVKAIYHEPSYRTGTLIDESMGIYVGWAERQGSFSDGMPLQNEQGDVSLIFSGEEYPDPEIALRLKHSGHTVDLERASYLVHVYEDDPTAYPRDLNGLFHGLVVDRKRGIVTIFNDRYGMHRLYYHESKNAIYFAGEAKAILAVCPELRSVDEKGLGEYVACGCVLEDRSLFRDIYVLPPGSAWTYRNGAIEKKNKYFDAQEWENQGPLGAEDYYKELRHVFSRNLPRYFSGREPIGMSLTGGLDTRAIMAWCDAPPRSLRCYTFGGMFRECRDVKLARRVAQICRQPHEIIPVAEEFLSNFSHYAERTVLLTDGCCDVSHSPDLYVNKLAARIAPVRVTGNYGDEVLVQRRVFQPKVPTSGVFSEELMTHVNLAKHTFADLDGGNALSFAVFRQAPWHHYGLLALEQTQLSMRSPYLDNDLVRTAFRAPKSGSANNVRERLISDGNPLLGKFRTDLGYGGNSNGLLGAVSRRFHLLTMKAEYAYDVGMPQWVSRIDHHLAPLHLERLFLGRHKFYHFRIWYRDVVSVYVKEMLLDSRTLSRPYLKPNMVQTIVREHIAGRRNYTREIHQILTLELIHRLFVDTQLN